MISPRFRLWLAIGLTALLALSTLRVASAHARLLRSNPEDGAVLEEAPREVYLWFDEAVAPEFSALGVLSADGQPVGSGALRGDPTDPTLLVASLPELAEGLYVLSWKAFSTVDSHETEGTLVFGIGQAPDAASVSPPRAESPPPPLEVVLRALNYATLAALVGSLLVVTLILHPDRFEASLRAPVLAARRRVWRLALGATLAALVIGVAWLMWQAGAIRRSLFDVVMATRLGALWLLRQGALTGAVIALLVAWRGRRWGWGLAGALVVIVAFSQALNSHAAGLIERPALAVAADLLHLLAAGAWVGSMLALLVGLLPLLRSRRADLLQVALGGWRRFGILATLSVGALAATGLYGAARQVASIDAWLGTTYGRVLGGKIGLFLLVGFIGLLNSMLLHPRLAARMGSLLRRPAGWRPLNLKRLPALLAAEAALAASVIVASGILTSTETARGPEFAQPAPTLSPPSSQTLPADDLLVTLSIRPNKPGPNILSVNVLNTRRPPPAETLRVLVRLTYLDRDLGTQTLIVEPESAESYRLNTSALSLPGAWRAQVVVRRRGLQDGVADFDWRVAPPPLNQAPRPVVVDNTPLEPWLTALAAGVAIATLLGVAGGMSRRSHPLPTADEYSGEPVTFHAETRLVQ